MNRPIGITILGWLLISMSAWTGIALILHLLRLDFSSLQTSKYFIIFSHYFSGTARIILEFFVGIYLLRLRPWARLGAIILSVLHILKCGYSFAKGFERGFSGGNQPGVLANLIGLAISLVLILLVVAYLSNKNVKAAFHRNEVNTAESESLFWKVYFFILLFLSVESYIFLGFLRIWDAIDTIVSIVAMLGFFGFCWHRKIVTSSFWKFTFPILILWQLSYQYVLPDHPIVQHSTNLFTNVTGLIIIAPLYCALYLYGFKSSNLWK